MRIFKTKWFARYARRERIFDARLCEAVRRAEDGLIDADLGGGVIKQRIARPGQGRSGGYRLLIAFRPSDRAVFMLGFAKSDRDNITPDELESLKRAAALWFSLMRTPSERPTRGFVPPPGRPATRPRRITVVDELPRTSVGKIRKFLLKDPT